MKPSLALTALTLLTTAHTLPTTHLLQRSISAATAALTTAAPSTASCANAPAPGECATAAQAAPVLIQSFVDYNVTTPAEWAAIVSLLLFESADFKYRTNHFPGRPDQGTRAMLMAPNVAKYAAALADAGKLDAGALAAAGGDGVAVLALVNADDDKSFGAGAWWYSSQCGAEVKAAVAVGDQAGFERYLLECVQIGASPVPAERIAVWSAVMAVCG